MARLTANRIRVSSTCIVGVSVRLLPEEGCFVVIEKESRASLADRKEAGLRVASMIGSEKLGATKGIGERW